MASALAASFLADIAAHPDDDAPRLIFADWLDDHGQEARAELIRLQCQLDPDRDRCDDPAVNALRARVELVGQAYEQGESDWFCWLGALPHKEQFGGLAVWRRGFVEELRLPAQWLVKHGDKLRQRYPLLRKLTVYRLNGWGRALARCRSLQGIREIEFPCWYGDADAQAIAASPHLRAVDRVVCWDGGRSHAQGEIFARAKAWPNLQNLHLIANGPVDLWAATVDRAAGRAIATGYDFQAKLFPLAPDQWFVGKLPDGTQWYVEVRPEPGVVGVSAFTPDGMPHGAAVEYPIPPDLPEQWNCRRGFRWYDACRDHLRQRFGFVPAVIRIQGFPASNPRLNWLDPTAEEQWGRIDDPYFRYDGRDPCRAGGFLGMGDHVRTWVTSGSYHIAER